MRELNTVKKIIKSPNLKDIADSKARKDGMEMVLLESSGSFGVGRDLEFHGKQNRAEHI